MHTIKVNMLATSYVFQAPNRLAIYCGMMLMAKMILHVCGSIVSQTLRRIFYAKNGVICKNVDPTMCKNVKCTHFSYIKA